MKRVISLLILTFFLSGFEPVRSQELSPGEEVGYINSLLKANPYRDTFLEITFYYSIDITTEKELVVKMDFDGPFRTIIKAKISDLGRSFTRDSSYEGNSSLCWYCKSEDAKKISDCVYNETITSGSEKESSYSNNICVMFAKDSNIREEILKAFDMLFKRILDQ